MKPTDIKGHYKLDLDWGKRLRPTQQDLKELLPDSVGEFKFLRDIFCLDDRKWASPPDRDYWAYVVEDAALSRHYIYSDQGIWNAGTAIDLRKTLAMYGEVEKQALRGLIYLEEQMTERLKNRGKTEGN